VSANSAEVRAALLASGAVKFGDFTLTSGKKSDVYVDVKLAWTDPSRLSTLAQALSERVRGEKVLAGMELGAVPLVVATALRTHLPFVVLRKAARAHGTGTRVEGRVEPGALCLLLEDVVTTGGSVAESVELLRGAGAVVERAVTVIDREEGGSERLATLGVRLESLATLAELRKKT
jgi:orotate phosphoribosyltransferase